MASLKPPIPQPDSISPVPYVSDKITACFVLWYTSSVASGSVVWVFCFVLTGKKPPKDSSQIQKILNQHFLKLCVEDEGGFPNSSREDTGICMPARRWYHHGKRGQALPPSSHSPTMHHSQLVGKRSRAKPPRMRPINIWGQFGRSRGYGLFPAFRRNLTDFPCVQDMCPPPFYHSLLQMPCQWNAHFNSESLIAPLIFNFLPL